MSSFEKKFGYTPLLAPVKDQIILDTLKLYDARELDDAMEYCCGFVNAARLLSPKHAYVELEYAITQKLPVFVALSKLLIPTIIDQEMVLLKHCLKHNEQPNLI